MGFVVVSLVCLLLPACRAAMDYVSVCPEPQRCMRLSRLIMGTDHLAASAWVNTSQPAPSTQHVFDMLDAAVDAGINVIDTSPIYVGGVEHLVGQWLQARAGTFAGKNPDARVYVLSKGGFPFDLFYSKLLTSGNHSQQLVALLKKNGILNPVGNADGSTNLTHVPPGTYASRLYGTANEITAQVAEEMGYTMANLHGNLSIYLMHRDDNDYFAFAPVPRSQTPVATILQALSDPKISANVWAFGVSNWNSSRVAEAVALAATSARVLFNSPYFSLLEMNAARSIHAGGVQATHEDMMDRSFQPGVLLNPYSPLGGWSIFDQPQPSWNNSRANAQAALQDPYWGNVFKAIFTPENEARFARLVQYTQEWNLGSGTTWTVDQMANAYVWAHPRCTFGTIGPITRLELQRSVEALELSKQLTPEDLGYLHDGNFRRR